MRRNGENMKKILLISNSFGVDATRYLYGIARSAGEEVSVSCLFIGGCSLYRHYRNMLSEEVAYSLYFNGIKTPYKLSLKEALLADEWDIVTLQQVSDESGDFSSYEPYLSELSAYVKKLAPGAKQYIHAIWAWSDERLKSKSIPYSTSAEMFAKDHAAYREAAKKIDADGFIPCTAAMEKLYAKIGDAAYRDGGHASHGVGRYMLGLDWFGTIFERNIEGIDYRDFDVPVSEEEFNIAKICAADAIAENSYKKT